MGTIGALDARAGSEPEWEENLDAWRQSLELDGPPPDLASAPVRAPRAETPSARFDPPLEAPITGAIARRRSAYWALPDLQRAVLCELFHADQAAEREERAREAAGERSRKACEWRTLNVTAGSGALAKALTSLASQTQTDDAIDALRRAGLLECHCETTLLGTCVTVRINRRARALVRAGLEIPMTPKRPPACSQRVCGGVCSKLRTLSRSDYLANDCGARRTCTWPRAAITAPARTSSRSGTTEGGTSPTLAMSTQTLARASTTATTPPQGAWSEGRCRARSRQ